MKPPYSSTRDDALGRQHFWVFFLKSVSWGETLFAGEKLHLLAQTINVLVALLFAALLITIIRFAKKDWYTNPIPILHLIVLFACLVAYRLYYPYVCNGDYRFIFTATIPWFWLVWRRISILALLTLVSAIFHFMLAKSL
jgi:hypothetical protein